MDDIDTAEFINLLMNDQDKDQPFFENNLKKLFLKFDKENEQILEHHYYAYVTYVAIKKYMTKVIIEKDNQINYWKQKYLKQITTVNKAEEKPLNQIGKPSAFQRERVVDNRKNMNNSVDSVVDSVDVSSEILNLKLEYPRSIGGENPQSDTNGPMMIKLNGVENGLDGNFNEPSRHQIRHLNNQMPKVLPIDDEIPPDVIEKPVGNSSKIENMNRSRANINGSFSDSFNPFKTYSGMKRAASDAVHLSIANSKRQHMNKSDCTKPASGISILPFNPIKPGPKNAESGRANPSKNVDQEAKIKIPDSDDWLHFEAAEVDPVVFLRPISPYNRKINHSDKFKSRKFREENADLFQDAGFE